MIRHGDIRRAEYIIDTSGIVEILETGVSRSPRGRTAKVATLRHLLLGMFLSVHHGGSAAITDIHRTLTEKLPLDEQYRLGIREVVDGGTTTVSYRNLEYQAKRLMTALAYGAGSEPDLDDTERTRRHTTVTSALNGLMDVFDLGWDSPAMAIDATGIWSWAKGARKTAPVADTDDTDLEEELAALLEQARQTGIIPDRLIRVADALRAQELRDAEIASSQAAATAAAAEVPAAPAALIPSGKGKSYDPDAAWGVKTSKSGRTEVFYGYHEHTLVLADDRDATAAEPPLIRRLELTPANADVVDVSLRLIDSLADGFKLLLADLHYSYKTPQRWLLPLIGRGIRQVHDLRSTEQGFTEYQRMRFAAGCAHCPATPDAHGTIPKPGPFAHDDVWEYYHEQVDRRFAYALRVVNQLSADGALRYQCPALAGKVGCPNRPGTVEVALELGLPVIENPPTATPGGEPLPACCTQETVKVRPPDQIIKLAQPHYWGSRQWRRAYDKRTYVEGSYGNRKNPSTENMRRGIFRSVGLVWANLVIGMAAASYNLRMLQNWHARTGRHADHPLLAADSENHGFVYLSAEQAEALRARYVGVAHADAA
jgi:hypothetical protein